MVCADGVELVYRWRPRAGTFLVVTSSPESRVRSAITIDRWARLALAVLIAISVQLGVWAVFAPRSFYDGFPGFGRTWVSADGPYNEHLIRDVGALNLAIAALFAAALLRLGRELVTISGAVALVWGVPHAVYHLFNTDLLEPSDAVLSLLGLALFVLIGAGLIYAAPHVTAEEALMRNDGMRNDGVTR